MRSAVPGKPGWTLLLLLAASVHPAAATPIMYVGNNGSNNMYAVNVATRTATLLGNAGVDMVFGSLGFGSDGTLYAWSQGSANNLYTVDRITGAWTSPRGNDTQCGERFDINPVSGVAYVACDDELRTVDLATGETTFAVDLSGPLAPGWAFGEDGTLYSINLGGDRIGTVDIATGTVPLQQPTGLGGSELFASLGYNPDDDQLYALDVLRGTLFSFDPATGDATSLGGVAGLEADGQWTMATFEIPHHVNAVPGPGTGALGGIALAALVIARRRPGSSMCGRGSPG